MAIAAVCPHCEALYKLADDQAGKRVRCRQCKRPFDVASAAAAARGGVHRLERPLGVPPATPPALPPSEPEPERLREEPDDRERDRDREPRFREPPDDLPPPAVPNNLVLWVGLGVGGALLLVVALCAGLIWHVSNRVGRGVDRMI